MHHLFRPTVFLEGKDDSGNDDASKEGSNDGMCEDDLNRVTLMLEEDRTHFERVVEHDNVHHPLNDEQITTVGANAADPHSYMGAPALEFENAFVWACVAVASPWMPHAAISQPANDGSIYKVHIFVLKKILFMLLKHSQQKMNQ